MHFLSAIFAGPTGVTSNTSSLFWHRYLLLAHKKTSQILQSKSNSFKDHLSLQVHETEISKNKNKIICIALCVCKHVINIHIYILSVQVYESFQNRSRVQTFFMDLILFAK